MVSSEVAWTCCIALAAAGCCLGSLLALTSRRTLSMTILTASLAGMALALGARPAPPPPPMVENAVAITIETPAVAVVVPTSPAASEHPSDVQHPIPVELSPPLPPEPAEQPARPAPQQDPIAVSPEISPVQAGLLGTALPGTATLLFLCAGPLRERHRRRAGDRRQWRAILELAHILQVQMGEPDVRRMQVEDPHRYAQLNAARERALNLLEPHPPRYDRRHLALGDLAAPQAVYAWADQLNGARRDLSEP